MKNKKQMLFKLLTSFGIAIVIGIIFYCGFLSNIENMSEDALYQRAGVIPDDIKIIAIDEETLSRLGPYSEWDRGYFAELIEILNENEEAAPKVIGMDIIFSGSNGTEGDKRLVEAAKKYDNLVVASTINLDSYLYKENGKYDRLQYVSGEGKPYDELAEVTDYGFTNAIFDNDGVVRSFYTCILAHNSGDKEYNSFAYSIAKKLGASKDYESIVEIAFTSEPGEIETISMVDVLDGKRKPEYFKDCVVLVGAYEEGMRDSFKVPINYSKEMYGVEVQANCIMALLNNDILYNLNNGLQLFITVAIITAYSYFALNSKMRKTVILMLLIILIYIISAVLVCQILSYKIDIMAVLIGVVFTFLVSVIYKYFEVQKNKVYEMRNMLFSMSEAMTEAIEGRTLYNANHTKNVAKRCVEMIDFINKKHKEKKTELCFSKSDKQQLYLAAMLHDVGKMDVPLEVMDKPTKLGNKEKELCDRLKIISLNIENDALRGYISQEEAQKQLDKINAFLNSLGAFNCGKPLNEDEWHLTIMNF